jgi:hypothetical protein
MALASPMTRDSDAVVAFEPYEALSSRGAWERNLRTTEQPLSLAVGRAFVAVATDAHVVHVFSTGGVHLADLEIGGAVVALAATGAVLAIAWHRGPPSVHGDQRMDLLVRGIPAERAGIGEGLNVVGHINDVSNCT